MLISDKVRELIFTGLGVVAAFAVATAIIFYFRLDAAQERIAKQDVMYNQIAAANERNAVTIASLTAQIAVVNQTAQDTLTLLVQSGKMDQRAEKYLRELVQSNEEIKKLFDIRLPAGVRGLFGQTAVPASPSGGSKDNAPAVPANANRPGNASGR